MLTDDAPVLTRRSDGARFAIVVQARSPDGPVDLRGVDDPFELVRTTNDRLVVDFDDPRKRSAAGCAHGDHPTSAGRRFCSIDCESCDLADYDTKGACAGICLHPASSHRRAPVTVTQAAPVSVKMPAGLPMNCFAIRAQVYSHGISARYFGLPVYLVGGALRDDNPRDIDLVVPVPDDLFLAMYNNGTAADLASWSSGQRTADPSKMWRLWARDCAKQSLAATMFCARTVDFKTQPRAYFDTYAALPRVRLDCGLMPEETSP